MRNKKFMNNISRLLVGAMVASSVISAPVTITKAEDYVNEFSENAISVQGEESDPYHREDPGIGRVAIEISAPTNEWAPTTPLDYRVPADFAGGTFEMISYPFSDSEGKADVLKINYVHNGKSTFGGITLKSPMAPATDIPADSTIEFDVYYPKSAQGKYMRWRIRATSANVDSYLRDYEYNNLNPDWIGNYNGETWLKQHVSVTTPAGQAENFILELHGENGRTAETGTLIVSDIKITTPDPDGIPLPDVVNSESASTVAPLKSVYNKENGLFLVGTIGTGSVTGIRAQHYELFVDGNNLKADSTHPNGPSWLTSVTGEPLKGATTTPGLGEYRFPTGSYQAVRDSGESSEYKLHGHVLAWYNQAPGWMTQIIPEHLSSGYTGTSEFYGLGNGVTTTVPVDKDVAKRVQFNHIMYVMLHFLTTSEKYGSSESRGIIPFNSWDVLNEEVHESRHSENIPVDINSWRSSLKHTNWLVAMSDDDINGDITDHYIYLLFKYAHIAAPNAQMAAAYKENYTSLPEYMKLDGHDDDGNIDAYIVENPPKLTYNDYGTATRTKARTMYNMVRELNTTWQSDPLYDGRPLIEDVGFQGHDSVKATLASDNQYAMGLFASLVDQGLLSGISFSELDLKLLTDAPGGGATAPAVLNVRQSDALGYQYALLYKLFRKFAPYIDHIMSWGVNGAGWQGSYVLFDQNGNANSGYYGAMDPDRFITGHSYLDDYFNGEYAKVQDGYEIDLGDLGIYQPSKNLGGTPDETPTPVPTEVPTTAPTEVPTEAPTEAPTEVPTTAPTEVPTTAPTEVPTIPSVPSNPTTVPTEVPTEGPTVAPVKPEIGTATEGHVPGVYETETSFGIVYDEKTKNAVAVKTTIKEAFESGKDVSYVFADENGNLTYSITMKADTCDSTKNIKNLKLGLEVTTAKDMNHEEGMLLRMKHTGKLPAETVLKVNVGGQFASGDNVYLYQYNKTTKKLDCVPNSKLVVDEKGYVNVNINSGADYILLPSSANGAEKKGYLSQVTYDKNVQVKAGQSMENIFTLPDTFKVVPTLNDFDTAKNLATIGTTVTYTSHDNKIVSIDKDGNIVAKKKGTTKIAVTVTLSNGSTKKYVTKITVK